VAKSSPATRASRPPRNSAWPKSRSGGSTADDLDATAFSIADNRTHEFASWNEAELAALLRELKEEDALDGVGYSEDDIDALVQQLREQEEIDRDLEDGVPTTRLSRPREVRATCGSWATTACCAATRPTSRTSSA
jgi:hypothetical protein